MVLMEDSFYIFDVSNNDLQSIKFILNVIDRFGFSSFVVENFFVKKIQLVLFFGLIDLFQCFSSSI